MSRSLSPRSMMNFGLEADSPVSELQDQFINSATLLADCLILRTTTRLGSWPWSQPKCSTACHWRGNSCWLEWCSYPHSMPLNQIAYSVLLVLSLSKIKNMALLVNFKRSFLKICSFHMIVYSSESTSWIWPVAEIMVWRVFSFFCRRSVFYCDCAPVAFFVGHLDLVPAVRGRHLRFFPAAKLLRKSNIWIHILLGCTTCFFSPYCHRKPVIPFPIIAGSII